MKKNKISAMWCGLCCLFLAACGGASDGNSAGGNDEVDKLFHQIEVVKTGSVSQLKITFAMNGTEIVHFVKGGEVMRSALTEIVEAEVDGFIVGWSASGGGKKVTVANTPMIIIDDVSADDAILISVVTKNGNRLFMNPDHVKFVGAKMVIRNGLMYYGLAADDASFTGVVAPPEVAPPVIPPVVAPPTIISSSGEPLHGVVIVGNTVNVTFATVDGYIVNVSKAVGSIGVSASVRSSDIIRVVWNGDVAGWDISASAPYQAALKLPTTTLSVPTHDIGNIRLFASDGSVYSLNTAKTQLSLGMYLDSRLLMGY